ncbi:DsbE family thiol:disulfide interchange protein [Arsenicitalea aurantiaca]|uniref:DsbE family thiol:disulfide interchange protein n=1 Tax=Arsenicitalea aurantiaca TaxID=1783274 RepID=A0A433X8J6_9HYPH|nr:DsbE family thiol:disulfide interchange protein [Arsenicitalea aurantiaca]RUT30411.1 DsbE family thiol:disulfide interchange protein [Arsenicitalea aurantiaca]
MATPLVLLVGLLAIFATNISRDPGYIPSVLINRPAPQFALAAVPGLDVPGFSTETLGGEPSIVNVFASWCIPCRDEHPLLVDLKAETGVALYGINQKDAPENAARFLAELGNPYDAVGADGDGRASIEWGVYGVPETFVLDADGVIVFKHVGPLSARAIEEEIKPALARGGAAR